MLWGTIVNAVLIFLGAGVGYLLKKGIPQRYADLIMDAIALMTLVIGITYAIKAHNILIILISLVIGALIGESLKLEERLNHLGEKLKQRFKGAGNKFSEGFVAATLLFCVGSMAIMGAFDSGMRGDHTILFTKSIMDGLSAFIFSSTMGIGVALSAVPVFLYQGTLTILSSFIQPYLSELMINEMSAVGGVLLIGLSLSILGIKKVKVCNLLPALILPILILAIL